MENINFVGNRVHIIGEARYGDKIYRVDSNGTIEYINLNNILVTIDIIDGDTNATLFVNKKNISKIPIQTFD